MAIPFRLVSPLRSWLLRLAASFSFVGLVVGTLFFAASLTPSLIPRPFVTQGMLSGVALAVGYGVGNLFVLVWTFFEIPSPPRRVRRVVRASLAGVALIVATAFLSQATRWQNSIRDLMDMPREATAYPFRVAVIAVLTACLAVLVARGVRAFWRWMNRRLSRVIPPRVAFAVSTFTVSVICILVVNDVFARLLLRAADRVFLNLDSFIADGDLPPTDPLASGSAPSLIRWDTIGRRGQEFVAAGPTQSDIASFLGRPAKSPLRVYAGYRSMENVGERARLALEELKRVGGFDRAVLIVATPTGTGWLDHKAVDTIEYLHAGDTAIISMGYSYLPSWMTLLVDPTRSRVAAGALFDAVYAHWRALPRDRRPKLYLHGLSLGSLGAESSADLYTLIEDPINGGVFSGPPFPSMTWQRLVRDRNPGSPQWLPTFRDGAIVRFTNQRNALDAPAQRWGPMRFVYLQHASDPMVFFSPDLFWLKPDWLGGPRGPDVSPLLSWYPLVTGLQVCFDLSLATAVPVGHGHNYAASNYIDAWLAVTDPPGWAAEDIRRLKAKFASDAIREPRPSP